MSQQVLFITLALVSFFGLFNPRLGFFFLFFYSMLAVVQGK